MRFANILYVRKGVCNIGDDMQLLAIQNLYKTMGVSEEEIVKIPYSQLRNYDGEYVILPICFPLFGYHDGIHATIYSPRIIPVFLSVSLLNLNLREEEIAYLKKYEPIGCRDVYTLQGMQKHGIKAYLNGCITATWPRVPYNKDGRVYIVDASKALMEHIPCELKENAVYGTQLFERDTPGTCEAVAWERYQDIIENARLVITSRLHCAVPAMAAGIKVICACDEFSYRFAWVDRMMPVYSSEEYGDINWDAKPVYYEEFKKKVTNMMAKRLWDAMSAYREMCEVSEFYEQRPEKEYKIDAFDSTVEQLKTAGFGVREGGFAIWGVTQVADMLVDYINKYYPCMKLNHVYDKNLWGGRRFGKEIQAPEADNFDASDVVLVTAAKANEEALHLQKQKIIGKCILCWKEI